jgi:hypothetical protein
VVRGGGKHPRDGELKRVSLQGNVNAAIGEPSHSLT